MEDYGNHQRKALNALLVFIIVLCVAIIDDGDDDPLEEARHPHPHAVIQQT